jgi:hypothetical protein
VKFSASTRWAHLAASLLIALVALEIGLPTGCIGFQAVVGVQHASRPGALARDQPNATPDSARAGAHKHVMAPQRPVLPGVAGTAWVRDSIRTRADAARIWGPPRRRKLLANGNEAWKYPTPYMKWRGAVVWAGVLPVPLLVPAGRRKVWLEFERDTLVWVRTQCTTDKAYGLLFIMPVGGTSLWGDNCR